MSQIHPLKYNAMAMVKFKKMVNIIALKLKASCLGLSYWFKCLVKLYTREGKKGLFIEREWPKTNLKNKKVHSLWTIDKVNMFYIGRRGLQKLKKVCKPFLKSSFGNILAKFTHYTHLFTVWKFNLLNLLSLVFMIMKVILDWKLLQQLHSCLTSNFWNSVEK